MNSTFQILVEIESPGQSVRRASMGVQQTFVESNLFYLYAVAGRRNRFKSADQILVKAT